MPFISDEELLSLQKEISEANEKVEDAEIEVEELTEQLKKTKKNGKFTNTIFGILSGVLIAFSIYLLKTKKIINFGGKKVDIKAIKQAERNRVVDSLYYKLQDLANSNSESESSKKETFDADHSVEDLKDGIKNQKVYSVQVGVFAERKFPMLSKTLAGIATDYEFFKYSVGLFNSVEEAQDFRKELIQIGFKDAFVASYINGKRQEILPPN